MTPAPPNGAPPPDHEPRRDHSDGIVSLEAALVGLVVLLVLAAATAISGCSTPVRYGVSRALYTAVDVADTAVDWHLDRVCPDPCVDDAACTARCDAAAAEAEPIERAIAAARRLVLGAIGALLAAEEDGEDPPDLRERLSCAAGALILVVDALEVADVELPVALETGIGVVLTWGGIARSQALGECRGLDDQTDPTRAEGETPPPVPDRDAGFEAPSVAPTGAVRDPWSGSRRVVAVHLAGALDAIGGVR